MTLDYICDNNTVKVKTMGDMSLRETLFCGQSFRWREVANDRFRGTVKGKTVEVYTEGDTLCIEGASAEDFEKIFKDYFDLEFDYVALREEFKKLHHRRENLQNVPNGSSLPLRSLKYNSPDSSLPVLPNACRNAVRESRADKPIE